MRRRRLIGVYRGLLMSIWMPWLRFKVMSAAAARGGSTKKRTFDASTPAHYPIGLRSTIAPNGFVALAPRERITSPSVALTIASRYARPRVVPTLDVETVRN